MRACQRRDAPSCHVDESNNGMKVAIGHKDSRAIGLCCNTLWVIEARVGANCIDGWTRTHATCNGRDSGSTYIDATQNAGTRTHEISDKPYASVVRQRAPTHVREQRLRADSVQPPSGLACRKNCPQRCRA